MKNVADAALRAITGVYVMKVRIRFSKTGALIYIGHLDVMRYFQKLFRRAGIPVRYSEGFSPHQILSFSEPLPLGMESEGEYADVELDGIVSTDDALMRLRQNSVPEITIMSFKQLDDKSENAMAAVRAARYSVTFSDPDEYPEIVQALGSFLAKDVINVIKKTKKNETMINLRPLVYELSANGDNTIEMLVSSGSRDNIKPALVLEALNDLSSTTIRTDDTVIKRIDQYTMIDDNIVSLDDIGKIIE